MTVVGGLDTDSFLNCFTRFHARHPGVWQLVSDNGTNFRGAAKELQKTLNGYRDSLNSKVAIEGIEWVFSPPNAPHCGGIWERIVRSVKKVLHGLMDSHNVSADNFVTLVTHAEGILNSRPLTAASTDPNDFKPLTPNDFLHPGDNPTPPLGVLPPAVQETPRVLLKRWQHVRNLADAFWRRWSREYVSTLQARAKWISPRPNIKEGELVLVVENTPRHLWPLARVIETMPDSEGLVRRVRLINAKKREFERHVTGLVFLEGNGESAGPPDATSQPISDINNG